MNRLVSTLVAASILAMTPTPTLAAPGGVEVFCDVNRKLFRLHAKSASEVTFRLFDAETGGGEVGTGYVVPMGELRVLKAKPESYDGVKRRAYATIQATFGSDLDPVDLGSGEVWLDLDVAGNLVGCDEGRKTKDDPLFEVRRRKIDSGAFAVEAGGEGPATDVDCVGCVDGIDVEDESVTGDDILDGSVCTDDIGAGCIDASLLGTTPGARAALYFAPDPDCIFGFSHPGGRRTGLCTGRPLTEEQPNIIGDQGKISVRSLDVPAASIDITGAVTFGAGEFDGHEGISVEMWVFIETFAFSGTADPFERGVIELIRFTSTNIQWRMAGTGAVHDIDVPHGLADDGTQQWIHVVAVAEENSPRFELFVNGTAVASQGFADSLSSDTSGGILARNFVGRLDGVRWLSRAMSPQEVLDRYNSFK